MRPALKVLVLPFLLVAFPAHAELYRWVDPQSGSVKFSNAPPPWVGDPEQERRSPRVEVVPYRAPGAPPKAAPEKPAPPAATASLEARWAAQLQAFAAAPTLAGFDAESPAFRQQVEDYRTLSSELDRLDPAGAPRRRAQEARVMDGMRSSPAR